MKKSIAFCLVALCFAVFCLSVSAYGANIKIGDYLILGKYNGEDILWRCIDIDENGPLMLSDKVISYKAFDVAGNDTDGSHGFNSNTAYFRSMFGSDRWEDSNIRAWLNSSENTVDFPCSNPPSELNSWFEMNEYAEEAGFLSSQNFSENEQKLIKNVYLKTIINDNEISEANSGNQSLDYDFNNYSDAFGKRLYDKMFLPDAEHISRITENFDNPSDIILAYPTAAAVSNSEFKSDGISSVLKTKYWLSTSHNQNSGDGVRIVCEDGTVQIAYAAGVNVGVRPAFYLVSDACSVLSGNGSDASPYICSLSENPFIYTDNFVRNTSSDSTVQLYFSGFETGKDIRVMTVCYEGNSVSSVQTQKISSFSSVTLTIPVNSNTDKVKILAWDNDSELPLCSASVLNLD